MSTLFKGALIATATMAGIYAIASTGAASMTGGIRSSDSNRPAGMVEFASARARVADEHGLPCAKCESVIGTQWNGCIAEVAVNNSENKRDREFPANTVPDAALYRAHREFSDLKPCCPASGNTNFKNPSSTPVLRMAMK